MWESGSAARVEDDLREAARLALVFGSPVLPAPSGDALVAEMDTRSSAFAAANAGRSPAGIPGLGAARDLYRAFGIDPTRTRPSSEALARRVLQGKGLPRILNAVDLCNLCALRDLLPFGLYDAERVTPPVTFRRGRQGEAFAGIRKEDVHLQGRPVLADREGPFGNPTSDSLRTSVTPQTRSLVMVIFAPAAYPADRLKRHADDTAEGIRRHLAPPDSAVGASIELLPA